MLFNQWYYFGDINPECGGVVFKKFEYGTIDAYYVGEFSPISFANFIHSMEFLKEDELNDFEAIQDSYYESEVCNNDLDSLYWMKAIDKEFTNQNDLSIIDKFVRYDYNVWRLIGEHIGLDKGEKILNTGDIVLYKGK